MVPSSGGSSSQGEQSRKRLRRSREGEDPSGRECDLPNSSEGGEEDEQKLYDVQFPREFEANFAAAIFELGLKHSSPKVIMPLMPEYTGLNTEHIKSHLQKYRIHRERSKEEFLEFFEQYMLNPFSVWEAKRGWELDGDTKPLEGGVREYEEGQGQGRSSHASLMPIPPQQRAHRGGNAGSAGSLAAAAAAREILQESEAMVRELRGICQEVAEKGQRMQAALERFVGSGSSSSGMGMGAVVSVGAMAGMGVDGGGGFAQHNLHGVENARFGAVGRPMTLPMPGAHASSAHFPLAAGMHPGAQGMGAGASSRPGVGSCALNPR